MNLDAPRLIRMQVELEYQVDPAGLLVPFPGSEEQARFIVYQHNQGYEPYFQRDLPEAARSHLTQIDLALAFDDPSAILSILRSSDSPDELRVYSSGVIPSIPEQVEASQAKYRDKCWVIDVAGRPVGWAWSVRQNSHSAELAVEVNAEYHRRGLGHQLAAAWAKQVLESGRAAFYSYHLDNLASKALASSLGVVEFAHCVPFD